MDDILSELNEMHDESQADLAASLKEINALANEAYRAKLAADEADARAKELKNKLSALMETAGVDKITADNCTVSGKIKSSVSVPKDLAAKKKLFDYIKNNHGGEVLEAMLTINARSFSSWHDKEVTSKIEAGLVDFKLEMVEPFEYYSIGMRKKAK